MNAMKIQREERRLLRLFGLALAAASCGAPDGEAMSLDEAPTADEPTFESQSALVSDAPLASEGASATCAPKPFTPDPPDACGKFVHLPCGVPQGIEPVSNCYLWLADCKKVCKGAYFNCHATEAYCKGGKVTPDAQGNVDIDCVTCAKGVGRVPAGLSPRAMRATGNLIGDYLASACFLEAAAVHAFRALGRDLAAHGAPPSLVHAAREAERDEVRHTRMVRRAARRFDREPERPRVDPPEGQSLAEIAMENAVEGCVRETFGALVASFQAARAGDPEIKRLMRSIAADETRHAALSWTIARWAAPKLDDDARARIAAKQREALDALARECDLPVPDALRDTLGLPSGSEQRALLGAFVDSAFS
jgi:hypothetical protein